MENLTGYLRIIHARSEAKNAKHLLCGAAHDHTMA